MSFDIVLVAAVAANAFVVLGGFAYWLSYRARRQIRSDDVRQLMHAIEEMQRSVDVLSHEVERVGEAQRFTSKLLADSQIAALRAPTPKQITPH